MDALLIDGVSDILQLFLSGEEVLPNRPEVRPPWDGDLGLRSGSFGICFQRVKGGRRIPILSELGSLWEVLACAHLFVVIDENEIGGISLIRWRPWKDGSKAAGVNDCVGVPGHGGQTSGILILSLIYYPLLNASRVLRTRPRRVSLTSGGPRHARARKQRGLVDGGLF